MISVFKINCWLRRAGNKTEQSEQLINNSVLVRGIYWKNDKRLNASQWDKKRRSEEEDIE